MRQHYYQDSRTDEVGIRHPRRILALILGAFLLDASLVPRDVAAQENALVFNVQTQSSNGRAIISLTADRLPKPAIRTSPRELLLTFPEPIDVPGADTVATALPSVIEGVSLGYDTVLIRTTTNALFDVRAEGKALTIGIVTFAESAPAGVGSQAQLELLRVQLLMEEGKLGEARQLAGDIVARNPNDPEAIATLANVEETIGRDRRALRLYDQALQIAPSDEDIRRDRTQLARERRASILASPELIFKKGGDKEYRLATQVEIPVGNGGRVFAGYDYNHIKVSSVTLPNGSGPSFEGDRHRGHVGGGYETEAGHRIGATIFANPATLGVGANYIHLEDEAATGFTAEYRRPNWLETELVVNDGWRDRVSVERQQRLFNLLYGSLLVSYNRYGMEEVNDLARSVGVEGELGLPLGGLQSPVSLVYGLEAEYVSNRAERTDLDGDPFKPLDLQTREVHSLALHYSNNFAGIFDLVPATRGGVEFDVYGGLGYDRFGRGGPLGGAALTWKDIGGFDAQLRADYVQNTGRDDDTVLTLGALLLWRF